LDQEIRDLEAIHQHVQKKKEKMLRLADLQRKIDESAEEMRHLTQDDQDRRPQHRELRQDNTCVQANRPGLRGRTSPDWRTHMHYLVMKEANSTP
jgi:FtsZ-binding cell division protein ZapB